MAVIHQATLKPTKLELLASWLPSRPWYRGGGGEPKPAKAGGFRLDDPQGEVGIEFLVVTDSGGTHPATYLVPLTYRGAPLAGAQHALVGTMEHEVLGRRWVYDGCHDPVLVAQLLALVEGRVQAQDQNSSDTVDQEVTRSCTGDDVTSTEASTTGTTTADVTSADGSAADVAHSDGTTVAADSREGTELPAPGGLTLRVHRVLRPAPDGPPLPPPEAVGHVAGTWQLPDGTRAQGLFAVLGTGIRG